MAKSGQSSSPPPSAAGSNPISRLSPVAALHAEAQKAAEEMVVDDFVDTYLRERPRSRNPYESAATAPRPASEESGIRVAVGQDLRRAAEAEVSNAEHAGDVVALEAALADRDDRISSLERELKALRDSATNEAAIVATAAGSRGRSRSRLAAGVVLLGAAALAAVVGIGGHFAASERGPDRAGDVASPVAPTIPRGAATPDPDAAPTTAPPAAKAPPAGNADATAGAARGAETAPAPASAAASSTGSRPATADDSDDSKALLSFEGHLTVQSPVDAEVVVQGNPVGRTNQRLRVRCGPRNVRLRNGGAWITPGEHVRITCMDHTTVRLEPTP